MSADKTITDHETDARFVAQTGFAAGRKLDPSKPADRVMIPQWNHINAQVKAEDAAGKLVLTYNNPKVVAPLADAAVASKAAAIHTEAAAAAPDPQTAKAHSEAAATAHNIGQQRAREAAVHQPPSVSPELAAQASQQAAALPPPHPHAPAHEQLDPVIVQMQGNKAVVVHQDARHAHPPRSTLHPHQVNDHRRRAIEFAHGIRAPYMIVVEMPDGQVRHIACGSRAELEAEYNRMALRHEMFRYIAAFDMAVATDPFAESVGLADTDAPTGMPESAQSQNAAPPPQGVPETAPADERLVDPSTLAVKPKEGMSGGAMVGIAAAAALGIGLMFAASVSKKRARI